MYVFQTRVTASQTGPDNKQTLTSIVSMMQDTSQLWLESEPEFSQWLKDDHIGMMLASRQVDVIRRADYGEALTVKTWIYAMNGYLGYRNTVIYDETGAPTATCWCIGVFVAFATGKMAHIPDDVLSCVTIDPKFDMEYVPRRISYPKDEVRHADTIPALKSDIDFNHHVNNAHYVRLAAEFVPDDFECRRMRVEYKAQAKVGVLFHPAVYSDDARVVVSLNDADGAPYAVVEFAR